MYIGAAKPGIRTTGGAFAGAPFKGPNRWYTKYAGPAGTHAKIIK
jgi:hypothetical protein